MMIEFTIGVICGSVGLLLIAWYMTKDAKPRATPHVFSATSSGADDSAHEIKQIFKSLETGHG